MYALTLHANSVEPQDTVGLKGTSEFSLSATRREYLQTIHEQIQFCHLWSSATKMSSLQLMHYWILQSSFRCWLLLQNVHSQHFICWTLISIFRALRTDLIGQLRCT